MTTKKALTVVTERWQDVFLQTLREVGHVGRACVAAKVSRTTVYNYRRSDEQFATEWDAAIEDAAFSLEDEGWRRARDGVDEPIIYKGMIIGTQKRYSDTLLMFLLKGIKPDKWADKLVIHLKPEQAATLQRHGLTPFQAIEQIINALDEEVDADAR